MSIEFHPKIICKTGADWIEKAVFYCFGVTVAHYGVSVKGITVAVFVWFADVSEETLVSILLVI